MDGKNFKEIPLDFTFIEENEMRPRAKSFNELLQKRRTVRDFSNKSVPRDIIEQCLLAANSAPSGANRQPWHFAVITNPEKKKKIREGAEEEEREFYQSRAPQDWLDALAPLGTDANKPFLERAPYLIAIFSQKFELNNEGNKTKNYYVAESVGIATGLLVAALHNAGLATLTHTPAPMKFLNKILDRPDTEKPLMVLVVGYPENDAKVPAISRKSLEQFTSFHEN
ncbi:MAG: nitroreductase family protein [Pseudohongiellaceae bacterium]|uniref:Nitroreductase family protein n=1 Tax=OM182 bacterium MED-G28 TaxID=1986256 RepID=A0A2A5WA75_9GAMM|nr:MAG: nitroreductase family protein [OM182 bacterium MED-G28]